MTLKKILIIGLVQGVLEGILLNISGTSGPKILLNHFSLYHIILLLFFVVLIWGSWQHLPILILIQDIASSLTQGSWPAAGDWITWPTYNLYLNMPLAYWLLFLSWLFISSFISFNRSRRSFILKYQHHNSREI